MDDQELYALYRPLVRSRPWILIISGGLFLFGAAHLAGALMIAFMVPTKDVMFFWKLLSLPAGFLAGTASWQMFRLYRLLSMSSRSIQLSIVSEVSDRARLALIFTGITVFLSIFVHVGEVFWLVAYYGGR